MTGLLISVRSADEAAMALAGGADLIDVKEPRNGALGAADKQLWDEVQRLVGSRVKTSVALGELHEDASVRAKDCGGYTFAKLGLAGMAHVPSWQNQLRNALESLPRGVQPVAVAYADWPFADSPGVNEVFHAASESGCRMVLIDTYDKTRGTLLSHLDMPMLGQLRDLAEALKLNLVLGGSITAELISDLRPLRPAYFAVRGAACSGDRMGHIELSLVKRLASIVHETQNEPISKTA